MAEARRHGLRRALLAGVLVVAALLAFTAWQALQVRSSLLKVGTGLSVVSNHLETGATAAATARLEEVQEEAGTARKHTRGPVWWVSSKLPWIGDDVTAVRVVAEVAHDLTEDTIPGVVDASRSLAPTSLMPRGDRLVLRPIERVAPTLTEGADDLAASADRVGDLETDGLVSALRGPVAEVQDRLARAAGLSDQAAIAANLLPPMLGGEGERTYLLVFQNNAEIRAQGGMPGALALVRARNGEVEMISQGRPADIGTFADPVVELTPEEEELFTSRVATFPQDTVFIPDFPRSAELLKRMWEDRQPQKLDGVISVDPAAMSYLLRGTGPLTLERGQTLTAANAADVLMRDVYLEVATDEEQNALFAETARRMFGALRSGRGEPRAMLTGLSQAASERRLMLWSAREEEQQRISGTAIAGELPVDAAAQPEIGLYVNDSSADKLSYYLDYQVDVTPRSCGQDGSQVIDVRLTATSTVPEGAVLPPSVVGPATNPVPPGVQLNSYYLYAPVGGRIDAATLEGEEAPMGRYTYRGRDVGAVTLDLEPGETRVVDYVVRSGPDQRGTPRLLTTPAATTTGVGDVGASAC